MCFLFGFICKHQYLIPQWEKEREERLFILFYCKFLDLLLTTFSFLFFVFLSGEGVVGTEKKEIYILYINIYVNCIVLLYRRQHFCLFIPFPLPKKIEKLPVSTCEIMETGFLLCFDYITP